MKVKPKLFKKDGWWVCMCNKYMGIGSDLTVAYANWYLWRLD